MRQVPLQMQLPVQADESSGTLKGRHRRRRGRDRADVQEAEGRYRELELGYNDVVPIQMPEMRIVCARQRVPQARMPTKEHKSRPMS